MTRTTRWSTRRLLVALLIPVSFLAVLASPASASDEATSIRSFDASTTAYTQDLGNDVDSADSATTAVQVVARGSYADIESASDLVGATIIGPRSFDGTRWLVERDEQVTGSDFDVAQHSELLAAELTQNDGVAWAVPAGLWVDADRFFAWRFFAWPQDSPEAGNGLDLQSYLQLDAIHQRSTGAGVTVAILDTGFDADHPLLASRIIEGLDLIDGDNNVSDEPNGLDDDGDGKVDEAYGHGTHVAGIIAQTAPAATILPIRVLDSDGLGEIHTVVEGIYQAQALGADIINISFGTGIRTQALEDAIAQMQALGVTVIAAAGNGGTTNVHYPAAYDGALSVAAFDPVADAVAEFSNHSSWVDVSAVGINIRSAAPGGLFQSWSGSSMATPIVAGQLALVKEAGPQLSPTELFQTIRATAQTGTGTRSTGFGQVSYHSALTAILGQPLAEPSISLVKMVEGSDANVAPGPEFTVGDTVDITYHVTNTGNVDLRFIQIDDATLGTLDCLQDRLVVGETIQCSVTETLTTTGAIVMEATVSGSFQSELIQDSDSTNFIVVKTAPPIVECSFNVQSGVLSVITDQDPVFLDFEYWVHQGTESSPSLVLSADDARLRDSFADVYYELAWFGLPQFTSWTVTVTLVHPGSGSSGPSNPTHKTLCRNSASPIGLDIDGSGAVERVTAEVEFDLDADGSLETTTEWFAASEGILFDSTIEGPITGEHLFGDQGGLFGDGFAKLATRDMNNDGAVSGAELNGLAIWIDTNTNGLVDGGEQSTLSTHGIVALSISHTNMISTATLVNGNTMITEDLWFPLTANTSTQLLRNLLISATIALAATAAFIHHRRTQQHKLDHQLTQLLGQAQNQTTD